MKQQHIKKVQNTRVDALSHPSAPAEKISALSLFAFASLLRILRKLIRKNTRQTRGDIPGWGRSSGGGHSNPLQYSCLENPMDRGPWQPTVYGGAELNKTEVT